MKKGKSGNERWNKRTWVSHKKGIQRDRPETSDCKTTRKTKLWLLTSYDVTNMMQLVRPRFISSFCWSFPPPLLPHPLLSSHHLLFSLEVTEIREPGRKAAMNEEDETREMREKEPKVNPMWSQGFLLLLSFWLFLLLLVDQIFSLGPLHTDMLHVYNHQILHDWVLLSILLSFHSILLVLPVYHHKMIMIPTMRIIIIRMRRGEKDWMTPENNLGNMMCRWWFWNDG